MAEDERPQASTKTRYIVALASMAAVTAYVIVARTLEGPAPETPKAVSRQPERRNPNPMEHAGGSPAPKMARPLHPQQTKTPPGVHKPGDSGPGPADEGLDGGATPDSAAYSRQQVPTRSHRIAPPRLPNHIRDESDPAKRAKLMAMHRLATARVRTAVLERRSRLLRQTIERATSADSPSLTRLTELRKELAQVDNGLRNARNHRDRLEAEQNAPKPNN